MIFDLHCHFSLKPVHSKSRKHSPIPDPNHWDRRLIFKENYERFLSRLSARVVIGSQAHGASQMRGNSRIIINSLYPIEDGFLQTARTPWLPGTAKLTSTLAAIDRDRLGRLMDHHISQFRLLKQEHDNLVSGAKNEEYPVEGQKIKLASNYNALKEVFTSDEGCVAVVNSLEGLNGFVHYDSATSTNEIKITPASVRRSERKAMKVNQSYFDIIDRREEEYHIPADCVELKTFLGQLKKNIIETKENFELPPFFVAPAHHHYNHAFGHCDSLTLEFLHNQSISIPTITKEEGYVSRRDVHDVMWQPWAPEIIHLLLSRAEDKGKRRMLLDTKHMTPSARVEYHRLVKFMREELNDHVPIIQSHTTCNANWSMRDPYGLKNGAPDGIRDIKAYHQTFMPDEELGLYDDEAREIIESDGLIGIQLDQKRLVNKKSTLLPPECFFKKVNDKTARPQGKVNKTCSEFKGYTKKLVNRLNKVNHNQHLAFFHSDHQYAAETAPASALHKAEDKALLKSVKRIFCGLIFRQIIHLRTVAGSGIWDHLTIGSDFEGLIDAIPGYGRAEFMTELKEDMLKFWNEMAGDAPTLHCNDREKEAVQHTYQQLAPAGKRKRVLDKIFVLNGVNFLKKYYTDEYLVDGVNPETGWVLDGEEEELFLG